MTKSEFFSEFLQNHCAIRCDSREEHDRFDLEFRSETGCEGHWKDYDPEYPILSWTSSYQQICGWPVYTHRSHYLNDGSDRILSFAEYASLADDEGSEIAIDLEEVL